MAPATVTVNVVASDQRTLLIDGTAIPLRTCGVPGHPNLTCLIAEPSAGAGSAIPPSAIELIAFNAWGDETWTFARLLERIGAVATRNADGTVTLTARARTARQPLRAIPGLGYALPLVSTLGRLHAAVWMNADRVVVAY